MSAPTTCCEQCGASFAAPAGGPETLCPFCSAAAVETGGPPVATGRRGDLIRRREIDLARFTVDRQGADLHVSWRWDRVQGVFAVAVAAFCAWLTGAFERDVVRSILAGEVFSGDFPPRGGWFLAVALPLFILYSAVALLINRTEFAVCAGELRTWYGPVPFFRSRRLPVADVRGFKVERVRSDDNDTYELHAVRRSGRDVKLIVGENSRDVPQAIRSLLTAHFRAIGAFPVAPPKPSPRAKSAGSAKSAAAPGRAAKVTLICPRCVGTLDPPPERAELRCRFCDADVPVPDAVVTALGLRPARVHHQARFERTFASREQGDVLIVSAGWDRGVGWTVAKIGVGLIAAGLTALAAVWWFGGEFGIVHNEL